MWASLASALAFQTGAVVLNSPSGVQVSFDSGRGAYAIECKTLNWDFWGDLGEPARDISQRHGKDGAGAYQEIDFDWGDGLHGSIRLYDARPGVFFRVRYGKPQPHNGVVFPRFTQFPTDLKHFSYQDRTFAPPTFSLAQTSTPWLLFDEHARSAVFSPASQFMVAKMVGDGKSSIGEGLNDRLNGVPEGLIQDSVLVFAKGIGEAWDDWGSLLKGLYGKKMPSVDSDVLLQKFGYWTDNGADYYYNYDLNRGYANTLLDLRKRYRGEHIPLGYMQLDSWWYEKSINDPSGKPGGAKKSNRLPYGAWNRYGGLMEYRADPDLFPSGLPAFQNLLGLPLAVHNRWIDKDSPYHEKYKISGVAAVDPAWWRDTVDYLASCGVVCYEQDWLDPIYANSPEMASKVGVADAFTDEMAASTRARGMSMQYCMATPRFFLQGVKYPNLTTIRTSGDRFEPREWVDFLYGSQLAEGVGVWPWCDVFKSSERGNLILSVLSGGPVGTGDAMGKEDLANIAAACRPDGVIVRPDHPIVPTDQTYINSARGSSSAFVASTYTEQAGLRTEYVFVFPRAKGGPDFSAETYNMLKRKRIYIRDLIAGSSYVDALGGGIQGKVGSQGFNYFMVAPESRSGIALMGDLSKIVPTGRARVEVVRNDPDALEFKVHFAKGEKSASIGFYASSKVKIKALRGTASEPVKGKSDNMQTIQVNPPQGDVTAIVRISR